MGLSKIQGLGKYPKVIHLIILVILAQYPTVYRVTLVVEYLGWVDLDLGSSPGWRADTVATL